MFCALATGEVDAKSPASSKTSKSWASAHCPASARRKKLEHFAIVLDRSGLTFPVTPRFPKRRWFDQLRSPDLNCERLIYCNFFFSKRS